MQSPRETDVDPQTNVGGVQTRPHHGNRAGNLLPPEILTDAEVRAIMNACNPNRITGARNAALIVVLYRCGLRISEAISLQVKDVDLQAGCIRVLRGKGGRSRTVGIDPAAATILALWMRLRVIMMQATANHSPQVTTPANVTARQPHAFPLFCTTHGTPLAPSYIRRRLANLARQAGIAKRVHPHGFRHTHAAQLREEGVDIGIISKQLGHVSILTTVRYLDHIAPTSVIEAIKRRVW